MGKKEILIASFDMEVGGVERSLVSMLDNFDYDNNNVDLMLYKHAGEFMELLPNGPTLLCENEKYATYRKSIKSIIGEKQYIIAIARILANINSKIINKFTKQTEVGYFQMQLMWKYAMPFLPNIDKEYDVAISYLWPHYFIAEKVKAKRKIAWIHTDYSNIYTDIKEDLRIWDKFDYIFAVSNECRKSFLNKYPSLQSKTKVMENITSPNFIEKMSREKIDNTIFNSNYFNIVTTGRICYQKNFDGAVKALRKLHDKGYKNIKWYVIGYGGDEEMIKQLIRDNNLEESFILLGKKINPYPYMKKCDLYVQPSRYEGKAVTVTEAKILGKPVMITNYTTASSQITNMIDGYIAELSVNGISNGIEELYNNINLREQLSYNCRNTNYSNNKELEKLYNLWSEGTYENKYHNMS